MTMTTITISRETAERAEAALRHSLPPLASAAATPGDGWDAARASYRAHRAAVDDLAQALRREVVHG